STPVSTLAPERRGSLSRCRRSPQALHHQPLPRVFHPSMRARARMSMSTPAILAVHAMVAGGPPLAFSGGAIGLLLWVIGLYLVPCTFACAGGGIILAVVRLFGGGLDRTSLCVGFGANVGLGLLAAVARSVGLWPVHPIQVPAACGAAGVLLLVYFISSVRDA